MSSDNSAPKRIQDFEEALVARRLKEISRKGKQLWMVMEGGGPAILFHFGMTGSFVIKDASVQTYKSFKVDTTQWPPKFAKLEMVFDNGVQLAFCDPRRLGKIRLRDGDPRACPPICNLGLDPILDEFDVSYAVSRIQKYTCGIKALLLDQERVFCGIGNWVADEVLYQANIHPSTPVRAIDEASLRTLVETIKEVLRIAVAVGARSEDFPKEWLFHYRWSKKPGQSKSPLKLPDGENPCARNNCIVDELCEQEVRSPSRRWLAAQALWWPVPNKSTRSR